MFASRKTELLITKLLCALSILLSACLLSACQDSDTDKLQEIRDSGVLRVLTRNGATTYYESQGAPAGFEYHLALAFADHLNVDLEMIPVVSIDEVFSGLAENKAEIAAAGLSITSSRQETLLFGPSYLSVKPFFIYNRDKNAPMSSAEDLIGKQIRVISNTAHVEQLLELKKSFPTLSWAESRDLESIDLLEQLAEGEIDVTIINSTEYYANRAFYPSFRVAFSAEKPRKLAWAMTNTPANASLIKEMTLFFKTFTANGKLARLIDRSFTINERQTFINTQTFLQMKEERLPDVKGLIEQVAIEYDLDWRFLAAISYQESHWDASARSPTGVRGMMMLTRSTALELNVDDRLDPLQSLRGGARYYKKLYSRLPASIEPPDRSWFALAAYNIGLGHVEDARIITQRRGGNPNLWNDVRESLPLLRQKKWYKPTKYGYARGDEAARYVRNIRDYYSLLTWDELNRYRVPPPRIISDYLPAELNRGFDAL
ncbi:Membrane-bound lytic murein transglycosylase F [Zhongshania aliphaticivorans]|uniref:Membrane-bound lytic murein transglycosylase F n=1 Tax=Zhongshania aliphaticivorans TaxID=1470434 RepID=A0A5S9QMM7_9GAMM|nr:membrane-bound lytic murein transglycosylase MltF [Zhongshania aliphaticivorans]CAA0087982.1 Membrane-bound lytic murein transglycosylase F [Zhongshania aliphaticivorans]CAA0115740.1 Membrane-bound lytic murein transglycosylase F [Zhongshania aliphaticivorans]CAA0120296.1 Membrane-bound lytic murein transglycosylase F [Zhongshania aliphaticivorans]